MLVSVPLGQSVLPSVPSTSPLPYVCFHHGRYQAFMTSLHLLPLPSLPSSCTLAVRHIMSLRPPQSWQLLPQVHTVPVRCLFHRHCMANLCTWLRGILTFWGGPGVPVWGP